MGARIVLKVAGERGEREAAYAHDSTHTNHIASNRLRTPVHVIL